MNEAAEPTKIRSWLIGTLEALSLAPELQSAYVRDRGVGLDELALQFDDAFRVAQVLAKEGAIESEVMASLNEVDRHLQMMTDSQSSLWEPDALDSTPEWYELRIMAARARLLLERNLGAC